MQWQRTGVIHRIKRRWRNSPPSLRRNPVSLLHLARLCLVSLEDRDRVSSVTLAVGSFILLHFVGINRKSAEAPGKAKESNSHVVTTVNELTSAELEKELSKRRLDGEQELLDASLKSNVQVVTGAVGPSYWLKVWIEGLAVSAMVDTGSQSTIVSHSLLHQVYKHMEGEGKPLPKLESPSTKLRGKGGHPIDVTAQVKFTFSVDGRSIVTPVFVQPDREQNCLLGLNVLSAMGITVRRANGEPLTASLLDKPTSEPETAHVNLVQTATIPGMKGCYVRAQIDTEHYQGEELLFEPAHDKLEPLGVTALESLISVDSEGLAVIPIQNYPGGLCAIRSWDGNRSCQEVRVARCGGNGC